MLDQLWGRPSSSWRRTQVFLVLLFWTFRIVKGDHRGPPLPFFRRLNRLLARFTPWQIIASTLTLLYAVKHGDAILGLQAPEPLARLYSRNYYRATWIVTALDAGFATAMNIRYKWLRDIFSIAFSGYYLLFSSEADEKLRKYRAICTVEMLRATWEKTSNPYIRLATHGDRPKVAIKRRFLLPRPKGSSYQKPMTAWIYFDGTEEELARQTDLVFDIPGGGFICMSPEHHEERNLRWTIKTKRPVISFDYGKAPEYPFPFAMDEAYDAYKLLHETKGRAIGMSGTALNVVLTGDSAGANIATAMVVKILETRPRLPLPVSLVYAYAALSFHFTSWMPASDLAVLRQESSSNIAGLLRGKDHLEHRSPLSVVEDERPRMRKRRGISWSQSFASRTSPFKAVMGGDDGDDEEEVEEKDKSLSERVLFWDTSNEAGQAHLQQKADQVGKIALEKAAKGPLETRLAMTSRTAFFNDRIISPPMCRAMALLYIGPRNAPDLHSDYRISPIFTPANLLAQFPPVYLSCGERDPFVDDTVIFAGKIREAKEARKLELLGRENKFGETLRMSSGGSTVRDPILDEDEDDWVQMKIIEGWSHGYLQMLSLLPEAVHAINMMADWIVQSFEKNDAKVRKTRASTGLGVSSSTPAVRAIKAVAKNVKPETSESDRDDDVLSFTPKKRSSSSASASRSASPAPGFATPSSPPRVFSRRPTSMSSSDENPSHPRTPELCFSPPVYPTKTHPDYPDLLSSLPLPLPLSVPPSHSSSPAPPLHPSSPAPPSHPSSPAPHYSHSHERALRDELLASSLTKGMHSSRWPDPLSSQSVSDDEEHLSTRPTVVKTVRSGSAGESGFVDAKDLLRRRRADAVWGISASSSAVPSDEEEEKKKKRAA